jgi:glutaredoxin 3
MLKEVLPEGSAVVMYTTRFCPFCVQARSLLQKKGVKYQDIAVDADSALRREMMQKSGRHTVPQIWIGESHIGGCDELFALERSGQLNELLMGENGG